MVENARNELSTLFSVNLAVPIHDARFMLRLSP